LESARLVLRGMRPAVASLLAGACAAALGACGGATKTVTVVTKTVTQQQSTGSTSGTSSGATTSAPATTATTTTTTTPAVTTVHIDFFRTPTANIGCAIAGGTARCDIRTRNWSPPPHPASCPNIVDYGQGLIVGGSGRGTFVCAGDTALDPTGPVVAYGQTSVVGDFACASASSGVTCRNTATGHGFQISREGYQLF
jgi:hypothetical protein